MDPEDKACWSYLALNFGFWWLYSFMLETTHLCNNCENRYFLQIWDSFIPLILHTGSYIHCYPRLFNLLALENLLCLTYKKKFDTLKKNMKYSLQTISQWSLVFDFSGIHQQLYLKFKVVYPICHPVLTHLTTMDSIGIKGKIPCHISSSWKWR